MGYWILIIAPIIFALMYFGSVRGASWRKTVFAETGLLAIGVVSLFNFFPEFPNGNMAVWLVLYVIASTIAYWVHYTPINVDYTSRPDILDTAKIERAKQSVDSWRAMSIGLGAGYLALIIGWLRIIWIDGTAVVTDPYDKHLVGLFPSIELTWFSILVLLGPLYECMNKTAKAADVLLSIKKDEEPPRSSGLPQEGFTRKEDQHILQDNDNNPAIPAKGSNLTIATEEVTRKNRYMVWVLTMCGLVSLTMIIEGYILTQSQIDLGQSYDATKVEMKLTEFKLKSTYPGVAFILAGSLLMIAVVRKKIYFKTQHKDAANPGFTELHY